VLEVLRAVVLLLQYACELCRGRSNSQYWHAYVTQLALQASATPAATLHGYLWRVAAWFAEDRERAAAMKTMLMS
jgi:hypothetical protein